MSTDRGGNFRAREGVNSLRFQITRSPDHQITRSSQWYDLSVVSRKPAPIKIINLEEGMPGVDEARLRMEHEIEVARRSGYQAVKLIHGYGSSGVGGVLRDELQKQLRLAARNGAIRALIAGEDWRISDEVTWALLKLYPEWKKDSDLGRGNLGISIVVL